MNSAFGEEKTSMDGPKSITATLEEELTLHPLQIEGQIPDWLSGTFVRNGPVMVQSADQRLAHWFDGPAMLHAFSFQNGTVLYSNKFLKTEVYQQIFKENNLNYSGFAQEPKISFWEKLKCFFRKASPSEAPPKSEPCMSNANVNVAEIANQAVALTETPLPVRFDLNTLDTLGALFFEDDLPKQDIFESAHPQIDKLKSEKINYLVEYGRKSHYIIYRYNNTEAKREVIGKIEVERPSYMHSFALTNQYIILVEFPLLVNPIDLLISSKGFINNFHWQPEQGTRFLIVNRKSGKLVKTIKDQGAFFAFHHVNAFEKSDDIILDIVTYPNANIIAAAANAGLDATPKKIDVLKPNELPKFMRYVLSMKNDTVKSSELFDSPVEFPRINDNHNTKPYRYAYMVDTRSLIQANSINPIYKIDTILKEQKSWQETGSIPGEPVFIPEPNASEEDRGVIVSIVLNETNRKAFLLILDAKTFKELARIYAPHTIPVGLHGQFFNLNSPRF